MVAPGFPTKLRDPQTSPDPRFHDGTVFAKNVWWEQIHQLEAGDIVYTEVQRLALTIGTITFLPFIQALVDLFSLTIPNDAGCQPERVTWWRGHTWPETLFETFTLCGETWRDIIDGSTALPGDVEDLAAEVVCLQINRSAGVLPPPAIIVAQASAEAVLADCEIDEFETTQAASDESDLADFNFRDAGGVGYNCLLGALPADMREAMGFVVWRLSLPDFGLIPEVLELVAIELTVDEAFTDPDASRLPPELTLMFGRFDHEVYNLQDPVQPTVDQRIEES